MLNRRELLLGAASLGLAPIVPASATQALRVAALFSGAVDDRGFMESSYRGLVSARDAFGANIVFVEKVKPERAALEAALRELAATRPSLVIAHGGQNDEAARTVAAEFPRVQFVVTQGTVTGANLASYEVLQEQAAFLAGALAAWTTKTGVVGHISGIRVTPGLKGRAAYASGVARANPVVKLLTNFSGNQDDNSLSSKIALAQADAGVDVIFTMLNAGRDGVTQACRARGIRQIGNVGDWVARDPQVFVGSAFADVGLAVRKAVQDLRSGVFAAGSVRHIGLEDEAAVRLVVHPDVPADVKNRLAALAEDIRHGRVGVPATWSGTEFPT